MLSKVNDEYTADYLWNEKRIVSFLKVDKRISKTSKWCKANEENTNTCRRTKRSKKNVFGTKMRSVIYEANEEGIRAVVKQQFEFAKQICDAGLVPIIEPEVDINA